MKLIDYINKHLGHAGRMIGGSKTFYRKEHPESICYFNACIFDKDGNQIWWGDIDITLEMKKLKTIYRLSKEIFYVTSEQYRSDFYTNTKAHLLKQLNRDESVIGFGIKK